MPKSPETQPGLKPKPREYRQGEDFRTSYINTDSIKGEGYFWLLIFAGFFSSPFICNLLLIPSNVSLPVGIDVIVGVCSSPFLILGGLQVLVNLRRSYGMGRIMDNARNVAVPSLPKVRIEGLHTSYWEGLNLEKLETGKKPQQIFQEEADAFLYQNNE